MSSDESATLVELTPTHRLRFREGDRPLARADRVRLDDWWPDYQAAHPHFHNGPVIACRRVIHEPDDSLVVEWFRTDELDGTRDLIDLKLKFRKALAG